MADDRSDNGEIFEAIERRALFGMEEDDAEPLDVIGALRGESGAAGAADMTLGGYIEVHDRVPAFEGSDGQPYTVDVDVEPTAGADQPFSAFLVFVRWAATGAGIMDHVESGDIAFGDSEGEARQAALELSLYEVRAELDAAIHRKRRQMEDG